jgi:hypothetical protein
MISESDLSKAHITVLSVTLAIWCAAAFFAARWFDSVDKRIEKLDDRIREQDIRMQNVCRK